MVGSCWITLDAHSSDFLETTGDDGLCDYIVIWIQIIPQSSKHIFFHTTWRWQSWQSCQYNRKQHKKLAALPVSIWQMLGHCFCLASGPSHTLSSPVKYYLHNSLRWETFTLKLCVCDRPHHHGAVMCGA